MAANGLPAHGRQANGCPVRRVGWATLYGYSKVRSYCATRLTLLFRNTMLIRLNAIRASSSLASISNRTYGSAPRF